LSHGAVAILATAMTGCPLLGPEPGVELLVTNNTDWSATVTVLADGQPVEEQVSPMSAAPMDLGSCPETVVLQSQTFELAGSTVVNTFEGQPDSRLVRGANFECGDQIAIEVGPDTTILTTVDETP
jgi:hypothetical protein